ncbi:aminoglycoside phosphotransferase family protein [Streptomyces sp. ISL-98]|uniref:aminoglycoside phosphotransferase family protein n=1 Tax=Streptomyces sp. ISL-98 TaxID=2819192 RepID=UPI0027E53EFA|nr:aminoglycoside phosphotransferase family protein [Streptomyces sp. ISL-98]
MGSLPAAVVIRTWQDEAQVLAAVRKVLPHAPDPVHRYAEGVRLSSISENGKPVDSWLIQALAGLLAQLAVLRREDLPRLPPEWPRDGHGRSFLRKLALLTEQHVCRPNRPEFGGLFAALGIPEDALTAFAARVPPMVGRPFGLLHTDLHRDNVIVSPHADPPVTCADWRRATYGDPLHDLATHLVRMRYPDKSQRQEAERAWYRAMLRIRPAAANGLESDLRHYVDFEYAQSVYPDVMRAARSLGREQRPEGLETAAEAVERALGLALQPLRLSDVPGRAEIERLLYRWHAARVGRSGTCLPASSPAVSWVTDEHIPEDPAFPWRAVTEALAAEGAAPARRVFKGTGHLNTVVQVESTSATVVVRRKLNAAGRREPCFLDEHVVLKALEELRGRVRAPRIYATGVSALSDRFAVHSYEGPADGSRPPNHPVNGLLPHEADDLVDQLCALVDVDAAALDPTMGKDGFYHWLSDRLVEMVGALPKESLQLARVLGLPGAQRLKQILARHTVTPRAPVLLHGDLNPWNLVRGDRSGQLVLIDWEMAMVGDPLYDLVRHLHLTPHRPEIRRRMYERWERRLGTRGDAYVDGWEQDLRTYRWIEIVRSAYVDLDRLVTGASLDAPNVRRAVDSYSMTLQAATASLGLRGARTNNPCLALATLAPSAS